MIYLDNAATTRQKPQPVIDAVVSAMTTLGNSARGTHEGSLSASRMIYGARASLAVGLFATAIALAIGNLVDPPATMVNSAGDYVVSFIVSRYVDGKDWLQKVFAKKKENEAIEQ